MNNSFSIYFSSNPPSSRAYKNFLRLKNYIQLTNQMLLDYNHTISEYETITNEYIQKLSNLSSKYTSCISQYQKTLVYSDAKIKELLNLFHRIPEVFSLQISKMKIHLKNQKSRIHFLNLIIIIIMKLFLKSLIMNKIQIKFQPMLHLNFKSTKNLVMKKIKIKILLHLHLKLIME